MNKNSLVLALYEISMSIGNSLELEKMLKESFTMMMSKLGCSSAAIYEEKSNGIDLVYAKPKVLIKNDKYENVLQKLEKRFQDKREKILIEIDSDKYYYLFELKNFGYLVLTKSNHPFDDIVLNSIGKTNLKLINAIKACVDHKRLKESQARLAEAQSIGQLGGWRALVKSSKQYWDDEVFKILGEEPQSFVPTYKELMKRMVKKEHRKAYIAVSKLLRGKNEFYEGIFQVLRKDGLTAYLQVRSKTIFDKEHSPIALSGTVLDITKQYKLEEKIKTESDLLRSIINTVPVRIFWKDWNMRYLGCNNLFANDAGFQDESELIGKDDYGLPWKHEADRYRSDDKTVMQTAMAKFNIEEPQTRKDGSHVWLSTSKVPLYDEEGMVYGVLGAYHDITLKKKNEEKIKEHSEVLEYQANHDSLTQLPNRLLFLDRLDQSIRKAHRKQGKMAVLFIDLDKFKEINDSLGHNFGDEVIREVAKRIKSQIRETDTVARFGGDEFVMILDDIDDPIAVVDIIKKIMRNMHLPISLEERTVNVTLSVGISTYPVDGRSAEILLKNADAAMYRAKADGRNGYQFYTEDMMKP